MTYYFSDGTQMSHDTAKQSWLEWCAFGGWDSAEAEGIWKRATQAYDTEDSTDARETLMDAGIEITQH